MQTGQPSRTALGAASLRAAHQVVDRGLVFSDALALRILGTDAEQLMSDATAADPFRQRLRWFIAMRSRLAEDLFTAAAARGTAQLVVLGAGLDTYAYRTPLAGRLRIFEVDHPSTQLWKRAQLDNAGIAVPDGVTFVPVDFERERLADALAAAGFDAAAPSFFSWLGVVPYLTDEAVFATLGFVAGLTGGAEIVFDYMVPADDVQSKVAREGREALAARVASLGETLVSHFEPTQLASRLAAAGFHASDDFAAGRLAARYLPGRTMTGTGGGAHIMHATTRR